MPAPMSVKQAAAILETVMKVCPCHRDALFISAQVHYLSGDSRSAMITLNQLANIGTKQLAEIQLMSQLFLKVCKLQVV
jgi:hypothetical protein